MGGDAGLVEAESTGSASTPSTPRQTRWGRRVDRVAVDHHALDGGGAGHDGRRSGSSAAAASAAIAGPARVSAAAPKPTMAGTFSMPARRARSCSPPTSSGRSRSPRRTSSAPARRAGRPSCGRYRQQVGAQPVEVDRHVAGGGGRVDVHQHAQLTAPRPPPRPPAGRCPPRGWPTGRARARSRRTDGGGHLVGVDPARAGRRPPRSRRERADASRTAECSTAGTTTCDAPLSARPTPRRRWPRWPRW